MLRGINLFWVHIVGNISYIRTSADDRWLNNGSFEEKTVKLCELHKSYLNLCVFCRTNM